jgi:hypothetical protein
LCTAEKVNIGRKKQVKTRKILISVFVFDLHYFCFICSIGYASLSVVVLFGKEGLTLS